MVVSKDVDEAGAVWDLEATKKFAFNQQQRMNDTKTDSEQFLQVDTTLFCPFLENFIAPTSLVLMLQVI